MRRKKQRIWTAAQGHADQLSRDQPNIYDMGGDAVPNQDPPCKSLGGTRARNHVIQCLLEGMRKCIRKPINYEEVREVTQEKEENPAFFQGWLVEGFRKFTNIDPSTPEGQSLLGQHFIRQSAPDIR